MGVCVCGGQLIRWDSGSGVRGTVESLASTGMKRRIVCLKEEQTEVDLTESEVPVGHPARGPQGQQGPTRRPGQTQGLGNLTHPSGG